MQPDELAARSLEQAAENDRKVLGSLAAAGDAGIRPGRDLAEHTGLAERTVRDALGRLEDRGLIRRNGKRRIWATNAGRSEAGAHTPGLSLAPTLDSVIAELPAEGLRAMARLQLAAVPARWHLAGDYASGWSGFVSVGPTKTGKTSIAALICRLYGLDPLTAIKVAQEESPGSLFARRHRDRASTTGYRLERSPLLDLPYACIDEWDKAPRDVRAAAGGLLLGNAAAELEGERFAIRPTIYVTLNTGSDGLSALHEAHVRRSVVLDTAPLRELLADVDENMARLFAKALPHLALERIRSPAPALPPELRAQLRSELRAGLTDQGWRCSDVEPLARIALGRAAITGGDLEQAVTATVLDYLTCAATLGHTAAGALGRLGAKLGGNGVLMPDPAAAEGQLERRHLAERGRQSRAAAARLEFVAARARAMATTIAARDAMGRSRDVERQAIAQALTEAAGDLRAARSVAALQTAWQAASPYIEQARAWSAARDAASTPKERLGDRRPGDSGRTEHSRRATQPRTSPATANTPSLDSAFAPLRALRGPTRRADQDTARLWRCPGCGATYPTLQVCGKCDRRVEPVKSRLSAPPRTP